VGAVSPGVERWRLHFATAADAGLAEALQQVADGCALALVPRDSDALEVSCKRREELAQLGVAAAGVNAYAAATRARARGCCFDAHGVRVVRVELAADGCGGLPLEVLRLFMQCCRPWRQELRQGRQSLCRQQLRKSFGRDCGATLHADEVGRQTSVLVVGRDVERDALGRTRGLVE
jgi:hypothetical protein